jgi:peroxiredoxin Q/BCP
MSDSGGLAVGKRAPAVSAPLVWPDGGVEPIALENFLADGPVLLCFYTNDFSPDCIDEWCAFRDYDWFASGDEVQVLGVSKSRPFTHRRFIEYLGLGFPLYSDGDLAMADAFGVSYRTFGVLRRARRSVFLVDEDHTVRYKWIGEHPLDPTLDQPPLDEIREAVVEEIGGPDVETFGFE